jgi:uncharacterized membrane protein
MLVHFPVALLSTAILFDVIGALRRRGDLQKIGWWMMLSGTVGLLLAVASGLSAEAGTEIGRETQGVLDSHKQYAFFLVAVFAVLFLWRSAGKTAIPPKLTWIFWGLYATGIFLLWLVAWYGGALVYEHGVSVFTQ